MLSGACVLCSHASAISHKICSSVRGLAGAQENDDDDDDDGTQNAGTHCASKSINITTSGNSTSIRNTHTCVLFAYAHARPCAPGRNCGANYAACACVTDARL